MVTGERKLDPRSTRKGVAGDERKPAKSSGAWVRKCGDGGCCRIECSRSRVLVPLLAHAPMEPLVALAGIKEGKATIWARRESAGGAGDCLDGTWHSEGRNVICNVTLLGGWIGRKSKPITLRKRLCCPSKLTAG